MEHIFSRWNSWSLNGDIKYFLEISLMGLVIQRVRPNHFSKMICLDHGDEIGRFIYEDYNVSTKIICLDHGSDDF